MGTLSFTATTVSSMSATLSMKPRLRITYSVLLTSIVRAPTSRLDICVAVKI